jgi:hypothetical protein
VQVVFVEANPRVYGKLKKLGLLDRLGPRSVARTVSEALARHEEGRPRADV